MKCVNWGIIRIENIPQSLKRLLQWVTWCSEQRNGRLTKVPYQVDGKTPAKTNNPQTWGSFAKAVVTQSTDLVDGIGLVFAPAGGLVGIDLDDALDAKGTLLPKAQKIVDKIGSYTEISPSGRGLHILCRATLAKGIRYGPVEIYPSGRYFTITGDCLPGFECAEPKESQNALDWLVGKISRVPEKKNLNQAAVRSYPKVYPHGKSDAELIDKALSAKNGEKFRRLFTGGDLGGYPSASEADLALLNMLLYWTNGDEERTKRLFRASALWRDKASRPDYLDRSLAYLRRKGAA